MPIHRRTVERSKVTQMIQIATLWSVFGKYDAFVADKAYDTTNLKFISLVGYTLYSSADFERLLTKSDKLEALTLVDLKHVKHNEEIKIPIHATLTDLKMAELSKSIYFVFAFLSQNNLKHVFIENININHYTDFKHTMESSDHSEEFHIRTWD